MRGVGESPFFSSVLSRYIAAVATVIGIFFNSETSGALRPDMDETRMVYFLLIGNSNMQGRATLRAADSMPHHRVFATEFTGDSAVWTRAVDPLYRSNSRAGMGPGFRFGKLYADSNPQTQVGLLCLAQAGSWMNSWLEGGASWNRIWKSGFMESAFVSRKGRIGAALVIFGLEHGWGSPQAYSDTLKLFVDQWRKALRQPDLPFVFLVPKAFPEALIPFGDPNLIAATSSVRTWDTRCISVRGDDLSNCIEDAELCRYNPDVHYSRHSNEIIAERFLNAVLALEDSTPTAPPRAVAHSGATIFTDLAGRRVLEPNARRIARHILVYSPASRTLRFMAPPR